MRNRPGVLLSLAWALLAFPAGASHLEPLANLHAAAGAEGPVLDYVRAHAGGRQVVDNTGSLTATFGEGAPHTLLIAGMDEPGYAVSGIDDEGYLRLQRLADPEPHYQFDQFFVGQVVRVTGRKRSPAVGVVAAPSVHLDSSRSGYGSTKPDELFVDIGASSREEALAGGVNVLDRVTLEKRPIPLGRGSVSAPWVSSRAGAAVLLDLADRMGAQKPTRQVTLAFVTQQFYYQGGLVRVLKRVEADEVIFIQPGGGERPNIAPASGRSSTLADRLGTRAQTLGFDFDRSSGESLSFGPFGKAEIWRDPDRSVLLSVGVKNAGTPVEAVDSQTLDQVARLLGDLVGVTWDATKDHSTGATRKGGAFVTHTDRPATNGEQSSALVALIEQLVATPGVSRAEAAIREKIAGHLPEWAKKRSFVDEKGNLVVPLGKDGDPLSVFVAHMDEIGFSVTSIGADGRLAVESVGGLTADLFTWRRVMVHGDKGSFWGEMTRNGVVDLGATAADEVAGAGVKVGTTITVPKRYRPLLGSRATARSLDDRVGCAVLLSVLRSLDPAVTPALSSGETTWLVFAVEEEIGLLGAEFVARNKNPERVYAIDSFVTSDSPLENKRIAHARLGEGFVIRAIDNSGIVQPETVERVAKLARTRDIPMQYGVTAGGNDSSKFVPHGAKSVALSWPLRYAHSPGEVSDLRDIEALDQIVRALVQQELSGESR